MTKTPSNFLLSRGSVLLAFVALAMPIPLAAVSFGSLSVRAGQSGLVALPAGGGAADYSGGAFAQCAGALACLPHRATFIVKGEANRLYRIDLPSSILVRGERTGTTLTVTGLETVSRNHPGIAHGGQLDGAGEDYSHVGGTLEVPAGTPPDRFRADLSVTVSYN